MNKYLEQLVSLSQIDKEIDAFEPRLQMVSSSLKAVETQHEAILKEISNLNDEIKDSELKKSQHDLHLKELSDKLKDISKKIKSIKTEKEQKALNLEEEIAKEQIDFANEEIERLDKVIEHKKEQVKDKEEKSKEIESKVTQCQADISHEVEAVEKQRAEISKQKEDLISQMSQPVLTFYQKIRKWAKNTAVVPVRKQACYGCFLRINDKTYNAVIKSEDIVTCPHCGRILYKENESEEKSAS